MTTSNRIVILEASEEDILDISEFDGAFAHFFEPDLGDTCTAVAVMPRTKSKFLTHLPTYGKGVRK